MTPQTISSLLILFITSQEVFCQDDVQSQLLKRIEKLETEMKQKSDLMTEMITVKNKIEGTPILKLAIVQR